MMDGNFGADITETNTSNVIALNGSGFHEGGGLEPGVEGHGRRRLCRQGARIGDRFLRLRLWEEMGRGPTDRLCPYTGRPIALHQLHSDEIEIDHILPFEETFDDTPANKALCFRDANRRKGKLSPSEAADQQPDFFDLAAIIGRTKHLPANKSWRFLPGAMQKWEEPRGFEDRQLNATGYLARVVRAYAEALFPKTDDEGKRRNHIWVQPGRMTAMLRHRWGLNLGDHNRKARNDHRHHAIDAAVVGVIDRRMVLVLQTHGRRAHRPRPPLSLGPCMDGSRGARAFRLMLACFRLRPCIRRRSCSTVAARPDEVRGRSGPNQWHAFAGARPPPHPSP